MRAVGHGEIGLVEFAEQRARSHIGLAEPSAFLSAQREYAHRRGGMVLSAPLFDETQQTGHDAGETVVIAALRHGVEMRADPRGGGVAGIVGQGEDQVGGAVAGDAQALMAGPFRQIRGCGIFAFAVAVAGNADAIVAKTAQVGEELFGQRGQRVQFHECASFRAMLREGCI